jgi:hypothetical protein
MWTDLLIMYERPGRREPARFSSRAPPCHLVWMNFLPICATEY